MPLIVPSLMRRRPYFVDIYASAKSCWIHISEKYPDSTFRDRALFDACLANFLLRPVLPICRQERARRNRTVLAGVGLGRQLTEPRAAGSASFQIHDERVSR